MSVPDLVAAVPWAADVAHHGSVQAINDLQTIIANLRSWIIKLLYGLATLVFTIGGLRYLLAGGDPGEAQAGKRTMRNGAIGYGIAIIAPILMRLLKWVVGA